MFPSSGQASQRLTLSQACQSVQRLARAPVLDGPRELNATSRCEPKDRQLTELNVVARTALATLKKPNPTSPDREM
jgi:hypothetical protein